ncbi:MAG TPA: AAA family ATPase [Candidatus Paceibacterota bacterium]|nr:AAA family ATPase [Candidatus Paceibacterota bacterium]
MATTNGNSNLPILWADLDKHLVWADPVLRSVTWKPGRQLMRGDKGSLTAQAIIGDLQSEEKVSLVSLASEVSGGGSLLDQDVNKVLNTIRDGLCIGLNLASAYQKRSGLDTLQEQNRLRKLSQTQVAEFNDKGAVKSAIAVFAASAYIVHTLSSYEETKVSAIKLDFNGVPETSLSTPERGLQCLLYHFAWYCKKETNVVQNGLEVAKLALLYFEAAMGEIRDKEKSFRYAEPFTEVSYQLENSDFVVRGFTPIKHTAAITADFRKVQFDEIVGNRRAKHQAVRTAMIMCCYDPVRKKNPFLELGSYPLVGMGFGFPGTGKTLQIAATATKLQELCDKLGLLFDFRPMPSTVVSTFQGGSAERMEDWMKFLDFDDRIVYGPVDDAENNFMNRSKEGVSAGVREVISVFLRRTEGASAVVRGNAKIDLFTNLPEIIDPAVISRVQSRFPIDGAVTQEDFLDQNYLWLRRYGKIDQGFADLKKVSNYEFLSAQKELKNLAELEAETGAYSVKDPKIAQAIAAAGEKYPQGSQEFFASLYVEVRKSYAFTSRDLRNIQAAVDGRILDFDLPKEWFDDPKLFYQLAYEQKVELLKEQLKLNLKGLDMRSILTEEAYRYLDTLAGIASVEFNRDVDAVVKRVRINQEADRRVKAADSAARAA